MDNTKERIKLVLAKLAERWDETGDYDLATIDADDAYWLVNTVGELLEKVEKYETALKKVEEAIDF